MFVSLSSPTNNIPSSHHTSLKMAYSIYDASIVPVKHSLESLKAILKKAEASEKASEFPETRLHPDMLPLAFQIHMITNVRAMTITALGP